LNVSGEFLAELYQDKIEVQSENEFKGCWVDFVVMVQKALAMFTLRFKKESYSNDKEWRYMGTGNPDGTRNYSGRVIPYQRFSLDQIGQLSKVSFRSNVAQPSAFLDADVFEKVNHLFDS